MYFRDYETASSPPEPLSAHAQKSDAYVRTRPDSSLSFRAMPRGANDMYLNDWQLSETEARRSSSQVDRAISDAKQQMQAEYDLYEKNSGLKARKHVKKYWEWSSEVDFLEGLKAVHETQAGVPLNYRDYPVTKTDPVTGRSAKETPWRASTKRQAFDPLEAGGSFCLGSTRGMTFRTVFGLDKPTNREVLTKLKKDIEAAKASGATDVEAKLLISRIVSHLHDPGSLKQFNQDLESRYGVRNTMIRSATPREAFAALSQGVPVMADLEGGWHWVMVQKSPRGQLWANDPLSGGGIRKISSGELGSRFEIIVDATTKEPIPLGKAGAYLK
jgi:hypothetical protein